MEWAEFVGEGTEVMGTRGAAEGLLGSFPSLPPWEGSALETEAWLLSAELGVKGVKGVFPWSDTAQGHLSDIVLWF